MPPIRNQHPISAVQSLSTALLPFSDGLLEWFETEGRKEDLTHPFVQSTKECKIVKCDIYVQGSAAILDYMNRHAEWNENLCNIGIMKVVFSDSQRTKITSVLWKGSPQSEFEEYGLYFESSPLLEGYKKITSYNRLFRYYGLADLKKREMVELHGHLSCEACDVDLRSTYGAVASVAYEVHHRTPLNKGVREIRLANLAVLCANCHQALHLIPDLDSVDDLKTLIGKTRGRDTVAQSLI